MHFPINQDFYKKLGTDGSTEGIQPHLDHIEDEDGLYEEDE